MVAAIFADDGLELARGTARTSADGAVLVFDRVLEGKGRLLRYYFGEGRRAVSVEAGGAPVRGTLQTRWLDQQRIWLVRVRNPVRPSAPAPAAPAAADVQRVAV
jgi:hypothetical protein